MSENINNDNIKKLQKETKRISKQLDLALKALSDKDKVINTLKQEHDENKLKIKGLLESTKIQNIDINKNSQNIKILEKAGPNAVEYVRQTEDRLKNLSETTRALVDKTVVLTEVSYLVKSKKNKNEHRIISNIIYAFDYPNWWWKSKGIMTLQGLIEVFDLDQEKFIANQLSYINKKNIAKAQTEIDIERVSA